MKWIALIVLAASLRGEDWPKFLGPRRDGTYQGEIAKSWPKEGPARSWEIAVGQGFAGPVVVGEKLFLFHRVGSEERLERFEAESGKSVWVNGYPATYRDDFGFDPGPRGTPAVADGRVFAYGADGVISAVDAESGKTLWRLDAKKDFDSKKGWFGRAPSPLVSGDLVLLQVGPVVALEVASGKVRWKTEDAEASYSSPALVGKTAFFLTRSELWSLEVGSGKLNWKYPFAPNMDASVLGATPLVSGEHLFVTGSYGAGAAVLRLTNGKEIWKSNDALSSHYATPVLREGFLYGFDGRQESRPAFVCVDFKTGKTKWRRDGFGAGTVTLVGDRLVIMLESGEIVLAAAAPDGYKEFHRAQILGNGVRAYPALADGFFYARSKDKLVRVNLKNE
jgi:outer membrane protein assembly factor BamB